jgi:hypothetical protein
VDAAKPCCGGAGGRYEDFRVSDGSLHSRWVKCAVCEPAPIEPDPPRFIKPLVIAAALLALAVIAFTQCAGPSETPQSPSYLPQR